MFLAIKHWEIQSVNVYYHSLSAAGFDANQQVESRFQQMTCYSIEADVADDHAADGGIELLNEG